MDFRTLGYIGAAAVIAAIATVSLFPKDDFEECNGQNCDVAVLANAECTDKKAKPHKLKVKSPGADIFWWAPAGYQFCAADDGPRFKVPGDEARYGSQFPTTERCKATTTATPFVCTTPAPACAPYFHWKSAGTTKVHIEYDIKITNTSKQPPTQCTIDPYIKNG